jgi:AraC-like DNA-binding protein/mannose-6-phosphate isomerase-like protein (cupin superfamily)
MNRNASFVESLHHFPTSGWAAAAHSVVRAGKVLAAPDYRIVRNHHVGQDVLFCLTGSGIVETLGHRLTIRAGELVWIANEAPHAHYAEPDDPWTLLWFRFDGPNLGALRQKIFGEAQPLVSVPGQLQLPAWFDRLFAIMRGGGTGLDLRLNQMVAEFLMLVDHAVRGDDQGRLPQQIDQALLAMRADLAQRWDSDSMAGLMRVSPSQIRRLFRKHLRISPHQWLLRERLTKAQTLISDSGLSIAQIAHACGFCDVYHFSREFKRSVGASPAAWRRREQGHGG